MKDGLIVVACLLGTELAVFEFDCEWSVEGLFPFIALEVGFGMDGKEKCFSAFRELSPQFYVGWERVYS